jgi:hypothetical protein
VGEVDIREYERYKKKVDERRARGEGCAGGGRWMEGMRQWWRMQVSISRSFSLNITLQELWLIPQFNRHRSARFRRGVAPSVARVALARA